MSNRVITNNRSKALAKLKRRLGKIRSDEEFERATTAILSSHLSHKEIVELLDIPSDLPDLKNRVLLNMAQCQATLKVEPENFSSAFWMGRHCVNLGQLRGQKPEKIMSACEHILVNLSPNQRINALTGAFEAANKGSLLEAQLSVRLYNSKLKSGSHDRHSNKVRIQLTKWKSELKKRLGRSKQVPGDAFIAELESLS